MKSNKISVLLTCFSEPTSWVSSSISSVINQSVLPYEIIVIDDSGAGLYKEVVDKISFTTATPIKYVQNSSNQGLIYSLNIGLDIAEGNYVARMDADDISLPDRFKAQEELLNKGFDIVGSGILKFGNNHGNSKPICYPSTKLGVLLGIVLNNPLAHHSHY